MRFAPVVPAAFSLALCFALAGCHVETHKNGKNDDVSVGTPFGSMHVKTDKAAALSGLGLTPYPGAVTVHKDGDKGDDDGAADVNMSFGNFKLGVHALEMQTTDQPASVLAFYRKDMGRYGAVITCRGSLTEGSPASTAEGLTCNADNHGNHDAELQLRTGSPRHQHVVSVEPRDGGTRIGLVALELPGGSSSKHGEDDRE